MTFRYLKIYSLTTVDNYCVKRLHYFASGVGLPTDSDETYFPVSGRNFLQKNNALFPERTAYALVDGMWISFEQLLRGQHFYNAVRIASGVLAIAVCVYVFADLITAATVASGALCVSAADTPSPWRHKVREVFAAWLISGSMYGLTWLAHDMPVVMGVFILVASFLLAFSGLYGKKAIPISFSGSFAIVMALASSVFGGFDIVLAVTLFIGGGAAYGLYAILSSRLFVYRLKLQVFAECSFEVAKYLRLKGRFYEEGADLEALYPALVQQQSLIVEKQQITRNFVFRDMKKPHDRHLARLFIMEIDFFETLMAGNTDYEMLQGRYAGSDLMLFMRDLMYKMSKSMEAVAVTALRGVPSRRPMSFKAELFAIEHDLERLSHDRTQDVAALTELMDIFEKLSLCTEKMDELRRVQMTPEGNDEVPALNLMAFTTGSNFSLRLLRHNLSFASPHLRYALRASLAMETGYLAGLLLSHFSAGATSRSYWIFLTVSVVLRSNFSMTAQRRTDRIIGSTLGCIAGALLLFVNPPAAVMLFCLFWAQVAVSTFAPINYRLASGAGSVVALVQIAFLNPGQAFAFWERIIDTVIGALIAYVASFVLPSWESRSIPQLMRAMAKANAHYMRAVLTFGTSDEAYRLSRKKMLDAMAELSGAFDRMLKEPPAKRIAVRETGRYITMNYLFSARIASISLLLARIEEEHPSHEFISRSLEDARTRLDTLFNKASSIFDGVPQTVRVQDNKAVEEEKKPPTLDPGKAELLKADYAEQRLVDVLERQIASATRLLASIEDVDRHLVEEWHAHHLDITKEEAA